MKRFLFVALAVTTASNAARIAAQSTPSRFEVASVKENLSGQPMQLGPTLQASGRIFTVNVPLRRLVQAAYGVEDNQVVGGPDWIDNARFDVDARAAANTTPEQARAMLRTLLAERFALATHSETRQLPIFEMTLASRDGQPGPQLRPSGAECAPPNLPRGVPLPPPPPPSMAGVPVGVSRRRFGCLSAMMPGYMSVRGTTLDALAEQLAGLLSRPVINKTGLSGNFDFDMSYSPENFPVAPGQPAPSFANAPELPTAVREQLGLRLESTRGPVDVIVIDRAERPTEN